LVRSLPGKRFAPGWPKAAACKPPLRERAPPEDRTVYVC
jgi:hypothetical protein